MQIKISQLFHPSTPKITQIFHLNMRGARGMVELPSWSSKFLRKLKIWEWQQLFIENTIQRGIEGKIDYPIVLGSFNWMNFSVWLGVTSIRIIFKCNGRNKLSEWRIRVVEENTAFGGSHHSIQKRQVRAVVWVGKWEKYDKNLNCICWVWGLCTSNFLPFHFVSSENDNISIYILIPKTKTVEFGIRRTIGIMFKLNLIN